MAGRGRRVLSGAGLPAAPRTVLIESAAVFSAMTTQPSDARKWACDTLIRSLRDAGVWSKLDGLFVLRAHAEQASLINWITPSQVLTRTGAPAFTADAGWTGDGSNGLDGPAVSTLTRYVRDSNHIGVWTGGDGAANSSADVGFYGPTDVSYIIARSAGGTPDTFRGLLNSVGDLAAANTDGRGTYIVTRTSSTAQLHYRNGTEHLSGSKTSAALTTTATLYVAYTTRPAYAAFYGSALTAADAAGINDALVAYGASL